MFDWIFLENIILITCLSPNSSPKLRTLARGLSPAYLRFGGTKTDFLIFDPQKEPTFEERSYWQSQVNQGELFKDSRYILIPLSQSWAFSEKCSSWHLTISKKSRAPDCPMEALSQKEEAGGRFPPRHVFMNVRPHTKNCAGHNWELIVL